jgi:acyl-CoA thioester hydrolase
MAFNDTVDTPVSGNGAAQEFIHELRVRYGECDMQGVVFNANYLAYVDDAIDEWFQHVLNGDYAGVFDCMAKKVELEWFAPAKKGDVVRMATRVTRWGRTSFDVEVDATVAGRPIFTATLVYVSVTPGTHEPCATPEVVREALGSQADAVRAT